MLDNYLFLSIVRGTTKDLVWDYGEDARAAVEHMGGSPVYVYNLFDPQEVERIFDEVIKAQVFNDNNGALANEIELATDFALKDFLNPDLRRRLFMIFADEIVYVLRSVLIQRRNKLPGDHPSIAVINGFLGQFNSDIDGDMEFRLLSRNLRSVSGGSLAGDCTSAGGMNYWTMGAYNAVFENNELDVYQNGAFFARFIFMTGINQGALTFWIHAVEFTPLARKGSEATAQGSRFADPRIQQQLLKRSLAFIQRMAQKAGVKRVLMTGISNSYGFEDVLKGLLGTLTNQHAQPLAAQDFSFHLLTGINSVHRLQDHLAGQVRPERRERIYLQGWQGPANFIRTGAQLAVAAQSGAIPEVLIGGQRISRDELDRGSRLLMALVQEQVNRMKKQLAVLDHEGEGSFRDLVYDALEHETPSQRLNINLESVYHNTLEVVGLLDPGAYNSIKNRLERKISPALRKKEALLATVAPHWEAVERNFSDIARADAILERQFARYRGRIISLTIAERLVEDINEQMEELKIHAINTSDLFYDEDTDDVVERMSYDEFKNAVVSKVMPELALELARKMVSNNNIITRDVSEKSEIEQVYNEIISLQPLYEEEYFVHTWVSDVYNSPKLRFYNAILGLEKRERAALYYAPKRPSEMLLIQDEIHTIIRNVSSLEMNSEAIMTIMQRIEPHFIEEFKARMSAGDYSEYGRNLMSLFPSEVIDYYRSVSASTGEAEGSLVSSVRAIDLQTAFLPQGQTLVQPSEPDAAMNSDPHSAMIEEADKGGIDLTSEEALTVQNNGQFIQFHMDPAQLQALRTAFEFELVINGIKPVVDLRSFLGLPKA